MIYLIKTTEQYRCDSEREAKELVEKARLDPNYELIKHSSEVKVSKQKGEIVDEWIRLQITKVFTEEKEPTGIVMPEYKVPNSTRESEEEDDLK